MKIVTIMMGACGVDVKSSDEKRRICFISSFTVITALVRFPRCCAFVYCEFVEFFDVIFLNAQFYEWVVCSPPLTISNSSITMQWSNRSFATLCQHSSKSIQRTLSTSSVWRQKSVSARSFHMRNTRECWRSWNGLPWKLSSHMIILSPQ